MMMPIRAIDVEDHKIVFEKETMKKKGHKRE